MMLKLESQQTLRNLVSKLPCNYLFALLLALMPPAGGPVKPAFGLSGAVLQLEKAFPLLVRVFALSIPTRSLLVPHNRLRSGENCSTPSPPDDRITQPSPDCDECSAAFPQTAGNFEC